VHLQPPIPILLLVRHFEPPHHIIGNAVYALFLLNRARGGDVLFFCPRVK
jgi:predicted lipid carrier protein YhbT